MVHKYFIYGYIHYQSWLPKPHRIILKLDQMKLLPSSVNHSGAGCDGARRGGEGGCLDRPQTHGGCAARLLLTHTTNRCIAIGRFHHTHSGNAGAVWRWPLALRRTLHYLRVSNVSFLKWPCNFIRSLREK